MTLSVRCSLLVFVILGLTACPPALFPVFNEETVVYDNGLVGAWTPIDDEDVTEWRFERRDDSSYNLYLTEEDERTELIAHLADVGKYRYLNMYSEFPDVDNISKDFFIPVNWFFRIDRSGDRIQFRVIDHDFLKEGLQGGSLVLPHFLYDDDDGLVIITASTKVLQAFLIQHEDHAELWDDEEEVMVRVVD